MWRVWKRGANFVIFGRGVSTKSSKIVRKEFLDYFQKNGDHKFVRSSPVIPYNDPTTPFVNAGMNQFKGVLLGIHEPPALKVVNSQKCIRIAGKHNDLDTVGSDTYHHTFFEMLGNWSFGDYFKKEACEYAWQLLTGPYAINKQFLYVTYFGGDESLGLEADLECKDIWLNIGVPEDRILPFGSRDNFWEMGLTGPCGPCTEIHIDHAKHSNSQAARVNQGHADLTELWNIVFIQYQRMLDGSISTIAKHHVDTGMGMERLLAVVQEKKSNYDTDLFQPLFKAIAQYTKAPSYKGKFGPADDHGLDTGYRIVADHARMIVAALSDGSLLEQNAKLRQVMRKAVDVSREIFHKNGLLGELSYHVVESLGEAYPEMQRNIGEVRRIIDYEEQVLKTARDKAVEGWSKLARERRALLAVSQVTSPGLVPAYKELQTRIHSTKEPLKEINGDFAYKLYNTYGLSVKTMSELAAIESLAFDSKVFWQEFERDKARTRLTNERPDEEIVSKNALDALQRLQVPKTDDTLKYDYVCDVENKYRFPEATSRVLAVIANGELTNCCNVSNFLTGEHNEIALLLDKTAFYTPEGGQLSDKGHISFEKQQLRFDVRRVLKIRDYIFHVGNFHASETSNVVKAGDECKALIDVEHRLGAMRNHTATHLLNAAMRRVFPVVRQRASSVSSQFLKLECCLFGGKLDVKGVAELETLVNQCIRDDVPLVTETFDIPQLLAQDNQVLTIPGQIYPDTGIRVVKVESPGLKSREACCGTHVRRTGNLEYFTILRVKSGGSSGCSIKAITGPAVKASKLAGDDLRKRVSALEERFKRADIRVNSLAEDCNDFRNTLLGNRGENIGDSKIPVPYLAVQECLPRIDNLVKNISMNSRQANLKKEFKDMLRSSPLPFVVHYLKPNSDIEENYPLSEITSLCPKNPILVMAYNSKGFVLARCRVPKVFVSNEFNALSWMETVKKNFQVEHEDTASRNSFSKCNFKTRKMSLEEAKGLIDRSVADATEFALTYMKKLNESVRRES